MKWIRSFFEALNNFIHGLKNEEIIDYQKLDQISKKYLKKEISFFLHFPMNQVVSFFENEPEASRKIHALAECIYKIANIESRIGERRRMMSRYKEIIEYHQIITGQISLIDFNRISQIQ